MRRRTLWPLVLLVLSCSPHDTVGSGTYFGFSIGTSSAPPPPRVVFAQRPSVVPVPGTGVSVVEHTGYDVFRHGSYVYLSLSGHWYRARRYGEPFVVCDVRRVPRAVLTVPSRYWLEHPLGGPQGLGRKHRDWRS